MIYDGHYDMSSGRVGDMTPRSSRTATIDMKKTATPLKVFSLLL